MTDLNIKNFFQTQLLNLCPSQFKKNIYVYVVYINTNELNYCYYSLDMFHILYIRNITTNKVNLGSDTEYLKWEPEIVLSQTIIEFNMRGAEQQN